MANQKRSPIRIQYHEESDMLSFILVDTPYQSSGGEETSDPLVVLHYDAENRLAEVEIEHASERLDLTYLRTSPFFESLGAELDVKAIRERLGLSQEGFADYLDVSVATIRNWEQGRRIPRGPARRLLELSRDRPGMLFNRPLAGRAG